MRLVIGMAIIGFPIALVLAWALELTPDGLKLDANGTADQDNEPAVLTAGKTREDGFSSVARQLGVDVILEGSVRRVENKVRITAQLINASSDRHLWSQTYDRELKDVFAVQDEIARSIVTALELAPDLAEAHVSRCWALTMLEEYPQAECEYKPQFLYINAHLAVRRMIGG